MILSVIAALAIGQCVSTGPTGASAPSCATEVSGVDSTGKLRALSVTSGGAIATQPPVSNTGTGTLTGSATVELVTAGTGNSRLVLSGTWAGTIYFEATVDGSAWNTITGMPVPVQINGAVFTTSTTTNGYWEFRTAGYQKLRVRSAAITGTATAYLVGSAGTDYVAANVVGVNSIVSSGNSVTCAASGPTCLGIGGVFTGTGVDTSGYAQISMSASSDVVSATNGVEFQWSPDGTNWSTRGTTDLRAARIGQTEATDLSQRMHDRYFRIKYTNGGTAQTFFRLQAMLHTYVPSGDTKGVDQAPQSGDDALLTKSVIAGRTTAGGGSYIDVKVNPSGALTADVTQATSPWVVSPWDYGQTAFGEARTASPYTLLDLISRYGRDTRQLDSSVTAGGTVADVTAESAVRIAVTGTSGDAAKLRTNVYWRYQAGRGQQILQTLYLSANAGSDADQVVRWGYFDDNDGLFWRRTGGVVSFCRRTSTSGSPVDTCAAVTLPGGADVTKGNIWEIRFQWLGVGTVKAYWNGTLITTLDLANTLAAPYMKSADLPLSWEIVNTGTADVASLTMICANVTAQGGQAAPEFGFAVERAAALTVSTTNLPVVSIRHAATFNSVDNRIVTLPYFVNAGNANQPAWVGVYLNPTLTGPSWTAVNAASGMEYDITASAVTGGLLVGSCYLSSSTDRCQVDLSSVFSNNARRMRRTAFAGTPDVLSVVARRTSAVDASVFSGISWTETP